MKKKSKVYVLGITILSMIALNMAHPVTPMFISSNNLPAYMFGVFFATMSVGNFIFSPIWGSLSDTQGRIKFLVIGLVGYGISQLGFGFSTNSIVIIIYRFLAGAFIVSYLTVIIAYLTDICNEKERLKYLSFLAAASTMGAALGSLFGGAIGNTNYKITFLTQGILCFIIAIIIILTFEETVEKTADRKKIKFNSISLKNIEEGQRILVVFVMIQVIIFFFAQTSYSSSINFYIESVLSLDPIANGIYMAIAGVVGFLANLIFTPILSKRFGEKNTFMGISVLIAIALLLSSIVSNTSLFFIFILLFVAGSGIYVPLQQTIITKLSKDNYGQIVGIQNSSKAIGCIVGSLFSGFIFAYGERLPFMAAGIALFIGFIILNFRRKIETGIKGK